MGLQTKYYSDELSEDDKKALTTLRMREELARHELLSLTPRELEVAIELTKGLSNKETARVLGVSPRTVEAHRHSLMAKMRVSNAIAVAKIIFDATLFRPLGVQPPAAETNKILRP